LYIFIPRRSVFSPGRCRPVVLSSPRATLKIKILYNVIKRKEYYPGGVATGTRALAGTMSIYMCIIICDYILKAICTFHILNVSLYYC